MSDLELKSMVLMTEPSITFTEYDRLKAEAAEIARFVSQIEVTPENVKESKKLLAKLNHSIDTLNRRRIDIKNEILKPYEEFAAKVKEIETTVKEADKIVRDQVREMEEAEREEKQEELKAIWDARIEMYEFAKVMEFADWLEPRHLNKTQTIKKSETEMTEFLERCERDIGTLNGMEHAAELIHEYKEVKDMATAMSVISERQQKIDEQRRVLEEHAGSDEVWVFLVKGEKDAKLAELLLKDNGIGFSLRRSN